MKGRISAVEQKNSPDNEAQVSAGTKLEELCQSIPDIWLDFQTTENKLGEGTRGGGFKSGTDEKVQPPPSLLAYHTKYLRQ